MAKMTQVRPVRAKAINTKWLKNALSSIGGSASSTLKSYAPNISEVVSSSASAAKSITKNAKSPSQTMRNLTNNTYVRLAQTAFKNAINDVKAGNLGGHSGFGDSNDFDNPFGNADISFGDEGSDVNINYYNDTGASEGMITLADSMNRSTEATLKTGKAQMDAYVAVSSSMMYQSAQIGKEIITHLAGIENNLAALVEYHNTNMNKFIESSMAFYDRMGKAAEEDSYEKRKVNAADVTSGGFNLSKYKEYVMGQFKKNLDQSEFGMLKSILDKDMLKMMADNPMALVMDFGMGAIMPKMISSTLKGMEQTFNTMMPNLLQRLSQWGEEQTGTMFKRLTGTLAKSMGLSMEKTNYINKSDVKINRGPMPFDGETKHAITNIITKELREQTTYLKYIAGHFGLKGDRLGRAMSNSEVWDYDKNDYIRMKDLDKALVKRIQKSVNLGFDQTAFGRTMRNTIRSGQGNQDEMTGILMQFYNMMERTGKGYNYATGQVPTEILDGIRKFSGSLDAINTFTDMLTKIAKENPTIMMSLSQGQMAARSRREAEIQDIINNASTSNILNSNIFNTKKKKKDLRPGEDPDSVYSIDELLQMYAENETNTSRKRGVKNQMDVLGTMRRMGLNQEAGDLWKRMSGTASSSLKGFGNAIVHGNTQEAFDAIGEVFAESGRIAAEAMQEHFFVPLKETLFGHKNADTGFSEGGLFSSTQNTIKDMTLEVAHQLTGKEYTDSRGEKHAKNEKSVIGTVKVALSEKFFGKEKLDADGKPVGREKEGILTMVTDQVKESFVDWHDAMFGELDAKGEKVTKENVLHKMEESLRGKIPKAMLGGMAGGAFGLASGGLLGAMIGGPIGGVVLGTAVGLATDSGKFRKWLFGDKELDNGFISKTTQKFFKEHKNPLIAGAVLGGAKGLLTGGGLVGTLVGGPIAGALMGMATTTALKSKAFHNFLFGSEEDGSFGVIKQFKHAVSSFFPKKKKGENDDEGGLNDTARMIRMGAVGMGIGGAVGTAAGAIGFLPFLAGPMGPVGGAMLGLAFTIRSQGEKFKEWLFGNRKNKSDDEYRAGLFGQLSNMMQAQLLNPLKRQIGALATDAMITFKYDILGTLEYAVQPITMAVGNMLGGLKNRMGKILNFIGNKITTKITDPIVAAANAFVVKPLATFGKGLAKATYVAAKQVITFPFKILRKTVDVMTSPIRKVFSKIFHPIKTGKMIFGFLGRAMEKAFGISLDPFREVMHSVADAVKAKVKGLGKTIGMIITAPFRAVGATAKGIRRALTWSGEKMSAWADKKDAGKVGVGKASDEQLQELYSQLEVEGRLPTNDDGTPISYEEWALEFQRQNPRWIRDKNDYNKSVDKAKARMQRRKDRERERNEKYIFKHSGGNRFEDTEENRAYIERKLGKKFDRKGWGNVDATDAGKTKDSAGMSDEQLSNADPSKMSNEVRQTAILQRILDFLTGKNRKWNRSDMSGGVDWDNMKDFGSKGLGTIIDFLEKKGYKREDLEKMSGKDLTKTFVEGGFSISDLTDEGMDQVKKRVSELNVGGIPIGDIFKNFTGKGYAKGTDNAEEGFSVVGEDGAEIVHMNAGDKVYPGRNGAMPVFVIGAAPQFTQIFKSHMSSSSKSANEDINMVDDEGNVINTDKASASTALAVVNQKQDAREKAMDLAYTAAELQQKHDEEEKEEQRMSIRDAILSIREHVESTDKGQNIFRKLWESIFSKKGIITMAILAFLLKFKGLDGTLGLIADIVKNIGNVVDTSLGVAIEDAAYQSDMNATTNGKGPLAELAEAPSDLSDLATGDLYGFLSNEEGELDHRTASKGNWLWGRTRKLNRKWLKFADKHPGAAKAIKKGVTSLPKNLYKAGKGLVGGVYKAGKTVAGGVAGAAKWAGRQVGKTKVGSAVGSALNKAMGRGGTGLVEVATGAADIVDDAGNIIQGAAAKYSTVDVGTNKGLMGKVIQTVGDFFNGIAQKVFKGKVTGKALTKIKSLTGTVKTVLSKYFGKISAKISAILGGNTALAGATAGVGWLLKEGIAITLSTLNGITGAARLFQVNKEDVDGTMRAISAAMGLFAGSTIGSVVDVVCELVSAVTGVNILNALACGIYTGIMGDKGNTEAIDKLNTAREDFKAEWEENSANQINDTYKQLQKAGLLPTNANGEAVTEEEFLKGVREGTYKANYDSLQDYNENENASVGSRIFKGAVGGISKAGSGIKNFLLGKKTKYLIGESGAKYVERKDGTYDIYDGDGNLIAEGIDRSYFEADVANAEEQTDKTKGVLGKILSLPGLAIKGVGGIVRGIGKGTVQAAGFIGSGIKKGAEFVMETGGKAVDAAGKALDWVGRKITGFAKSVGASVKSGFNFVFKPTAETVYFLSDGSGCFYDTKGQMYNASGQAMIGQTIDEDTLEDLVKSGTVYPGEYEGRSKLQQNVAGFVTDTTNRVKTVVGKVKEVGSNLKEGAASIAKKAGEKIKSVKDAVVKHTKNAISYFTDRETIFVGEDGSYYKSDGSGVYDKYSSNGMKLTDEGKFTEDEISGMVEAGLLVVDKEDSAFVSDVKGAAKNIKEKAQEIGKKFVTGVKNFFGPVAETANAVLDQVTTRASEIGSIVSTHASKVFDYFTQPSDLQTIWVEADGTFYQSNGSGGYDKFNANGDPLTTDGPFTAEDISDMVQSGLLVKETYGGPPQAFLDARDLIVDVRDKAADFFKTGFGHVKSFFVKVKDKLEGVKEKGEEIINNGIFKSISDVFEPQKKEGWYDGTNGSYYVKNGDTYDHYNINGDKIESGVDASMVEAMIESGSLTLHEIKTDSKAKEALDSIFDAAQDAWDAAKRTVTSAWERFKNWLSGGSGASKIANSRVTKSNLVAGPSLTETVIANNPGLQTSSTSSTSSIIPSTQTTDSSTSILDSVNRNSGSSGRGRRGLRRGGGRGETPDTVNGYPYVSQNDPRWSGVDYEWNHDGATIGDTGCGPAAMSMAIGGLTGRNINPVDLARFAQSEGTRDDTGTNWNFIGDAARNYGLASSQTYEPSADSINRSLDRGNPVVLSGYSSGGDTPYTSAGHYVVAVGRDKDGRILVNDPRGEQYSRAYSPQELSKYTGSSWEIGFARGGSGNTRFLRAFGGRGADELNGFPFLMQADSRWGGNMYSVRGDAGQTIGNSGCGPTSMAMILRSFGADVTPVETCQMAIEMGHRTQNNGTSLAYFPDAAARYGLTTEPQGFHAENSAVIERLSKGWPVVASMGPGNFTSAGHYMVLCGTNGTDTVIVNDPASRERSHEWPVSTVTSEANAQFYSFNKNGVGSINNLAAVGSISGAATATQSDVNPTEGSPGMLDQVNSFWQEVGNRAFKGLMTGTFDSDYSSFWNPQAAITAANTSQTATSTVGAANLTGNTNTEKIWNFLTTTAGFTKEGAAGLMGNLHAESGMEPTNLQNTFETSLGLNDAAYTAGVDNGSYSNFVHDSAGYGLAQWTYWSRKQKLLDYMKGKGLSIGDLGGQLEFLLQELQTSYPSVYSALKSASSLQEASNVVLHDFEAPRDQSASVEAERASYGESFYNMYSGGSGKGRRRRLHKFLDLIKGGFGLGHFLRNKLRGGRGATAGDAREAVVGWMLCLIKRNSYTQSGARTQVMDGVDGHGYGDCSSTCWKVYERATGAQIGTYTGDMWNSGTMIGDVNTSKETVPDESVMLPGDLVFFYSGEPNSDLSSSLGHVEMYIGNGQLAGHGGGTGPNIREMKSYCLDSRVGNGYGPWACIVRYITTDTIGSMTITQPDPSKLKVKNTFTDGKGFSANGANMSEAVSGTANGSAAASTSGGVASSADALSSVSGFFNEVAVRGINGLFGDEFNSDYTSYWNGTMNQTTTSGTSTSGAMSTGSEFPKYDLNDSQIEDIATCITGETGGESLMASRQEASQMANLNEVTYGNSATGDAITGTIHSGWYASGSWTRGCTDTARQAVKDVLINGQRTLPRYVTEHDMFPLDAAISGHWGNGSSEDRSQYVRHQTQIVQNPSRFSGGGATYTFYDFFGENKDGDVAGYYPQHYEKYKNDQPWGGGGGRGIGLSPFATSKQYRDAQEALKTEQKTRRQWKSKGLSQGSTGSAIRYAKRRWRGGYGATPVNNTMSLSSNAIGNDTYSNSSLMSILQRAEAARSGGNEAELLACVVEILAIIADNTGVSANSLAKANALLSALQGTGGKTTVVATGGKNADLTTPAAIQSAVSSPPSRNMVLAQRIAAGK